MVGWFGFSYTIVVFNIAGVSLRQMLCERRLLGRMSATMRFLSWGVMPFGALLGGLLGTELGVRGALWASQIGYLAIPAVLLASPLRVMRHAPAPAIEVVS